MTTRDLENMKEKILREIRTGKEEILEEFLRKAKQIEEYLEMLDRVGIDSDRYICTEDSEEWLADSKVEKASVTESLKLFRNIREDKTEAIDTFERTGSKKFALLNNYEEYLEMENLEDVYNALDRAEEEIDSLIL